MGESNRFLLPENKEVPQPSDSVTGWMLRVCQLDKERLANQLFQLFYCAREGRKSHRFLSRPNGTTCARIQRLDH